MFAKMCDVPSRIYEIYKMKNTITSVARQMNT